MIGRTPKHARRAADLARQEADFTAEGAPPPGPLAQSDPDVVAGSLARRTNPPPDSACGGAAASRGNCLSCEFLSP
jgi:hypothetical protein